MSQGQQVYYCRIILKTTTWQRDSHGLFDYESKNVIKKQLRTSVDCNIVRVGNEISVIYDHENLADYLNQSGGRVLCCIRQIDSRFHLCQAEYAYVEKLWLVVKSIKSSNNIRGYKLGEGEIIKLGRVKYCVKEIQTKFKQQKHGDNERRNSQNRPQQEIQKISNQFQTNCAYDQENSVKSETELTSQFPCRICWYEKYTIENPLITPCKCSGTMRAIHLKCLQQWLKNRLQMKQSGSSISFFWKNLDCELCKVSYPSVVNLEGKHIDLIEIPKPDSDFIILEALSRENQATRSLHMISLQNKSDIKLGRGHDSDVRISDISVSRLHAIINLNQGDFYLEDHDSKFGTLAQLRKPVIIGPHSNFSIQVGRSVIQFQMKKSWSFIPSCLLCCTKQNQEIQQFHQESIRTEASGNMQNHSQHNINILALNNQEDRNFLEVRNVQQRESESSRNSGPEQESDSSSNSQESDENGEEQRQQRSDQVINLSDEPMESQRMQSIEQTQQFSNMQNSQVLNVRPIQRNSTQNNQLAQDQQVQNMNQRELQEYADLEVQELAVFSPTSVIQMQIVEQEKEQQKRQKVNI